MRLEYFELIDRIEEIDLDGGRIQARGAIPKHSPVFEGHFPGHPIMPGVLLIESMAQTSGWLLVAKIEFSRMAFLASVQQAKLRDFVAPGTEITVEAFLEHEGSGFGVTKGRVTSAGKPIADAEIRFRLLPFPSQEFGDALKARAEKIGLKIGA
jgi:3-hydroxyacyl-[acyl-carrier-protein] dehydratase